MSKSVLYAVNSNAQTVLPNGVINLGTPVRRYGCNLNMSNGNLEVVGAGYYGIDVNITATVTGTGLATVSLYKDGVAISGASQSVTVGTTGDVVSFNIPCEIRMGCCPCNVDQITAVLSGAITSASVTNASILARKD